jgi:hypothetical protein
MATAVILSGCPDDETDEPDAGIDAVADVGGDVADTTGGDSADGSDATEDVGPDIPDDPNCDPLMTARCALPWPSNKYLAEDSERTTGYTLSFGPETLPPNTQGTHASPEPYKRLDGYGVGSPIMATFENLDASGLPNENDIAASMAEDAQILLYRVDGETVERVPYWAEVDYKAEEDARRKMLIVRPAVILQEDARYLVAFRDLQTTDGEAIEPSTAFRALVEGRTREGSLIGQRQERFDEIVGILEDQGVSPDALTLAWDFHTASSDALHGSMLHMRERGFEIVGQKGPELTIEESNVKRYYKTDDGSGRPVDPEMALEIKGTFRVPRFTEQVNINGSNGWVFNRGADGMPEQNGWKESPFWMVVPHSAINEVDGGGTAPGNGNAHGLVQYGHGLLGTGRQTITEDANPSIANKHDFMFFGSSLFGMAKEDQLTAVGAVSDISKFPFMADRLHQGMLEYLLLARGIKERLAETDVAQKYGLKINDQELFYSGISQGGIFGGTYMALSQEVTRGHLGVPGNNYSTLLDRSTGFEQFFEILSVNYDNRLDQLLVLSTIQLLWGQTDPVSYLQHIKADPFADTPSHDVLLAPVKGDHQVAVVTNEVAARTDNDIELMDNYPREVDLVEPVSFPHDGSGVVLYDFGNRWPTPGNHIPQEMMEDPHGKARDAAWHNEQMVHFFRNGQITNTCNDDGSPTCTPQ